MKILWHSVAPWVGTGYGQQTATFVPRIRAMGHDVAVSAFYGLHGSQLEWRGIKVYPAYAESYGTDVVVTHALDHFGVDGLTFQEAAASGLIITLCDVWVLNAPMLPEMAVAAWTPVDHLAMPGLTRGWFERSGAQPIAMSRFGEQAMRHAGLNPLYVPHGINTSVFCPGDRSEARERLGLPDDRFIVAMVAANVGRDGNRKAFAEQIAAFSELHRRHSDTMLMLHTDVTSYVGEDLVRLLTRLPDDSYRYTDQYAYRRGLPSETVADVYRAANILSNCSWGEGFGIPIVEAQACGTPVVVTDATAMRELCGAGWRVDYTPLWHESQDGWCAPPHLDSIIDAYVEAYDKADGLREQATEFAQMYDADFVSDVFWKPALDTLAAALQERTQDIRTAPPKPKLPKVVESDGLLWVDRGSGTEDYLGPSRHEDALWPIVESLVPDGGVVMDVGAHVGHWTLRLSRKASRVIAVEPNQDALSVLRRNVGVNDIRNVDIYEVAAWDEEARLRLDDPNRHVAGGSTRTLPDEYGTVRGARLDKMVGVYRLDLVKLDVEGADLRALRGMSGLLAEHRPVLFIECHDYAGYYTRAELESTLAELGYFGQVAYTYQSTWSPHGELDIPVEADYMIAKPLDRYTEIADAAVSQHGASQFVDELARAVAMVDSVDPEVVVEIGCDTGGTLYAWRQVCDRVYGITLADNGYSTGGGGGPLETHGAVVHIGDSHDPTSLEWLSENVDKADVLVVDGDHRVSGVLQDLQMYGPLVRDGGLILLHDIHSTGDPRAEVHKLWPRLHELKTSEIGNGHGYGWGVIHVEGLFRFEGASS